MLRAGLIRTNGKQNISSDHLFVRVTFAEDELQTYNGVLPPESSLIRVLAACDVAWGGG